MKTRLLFSFILFISSFSYGQSLQTVQRLIARNDYPAAKKELDLVAAEKKSATDPAFWFYKGKVYTAVARQEGGDKADAGADMLRQAFEAFKRYQEMDGGNKLMLLEDHMGYFQLYDINYNAGVEYYNGQDYARAFNYLRNAAEISEYGGKKGFTFQGHSFPAFDTSLINLTGSAAYLAKKVDESIPYFEKLAAAGIDGEDYKAVYSLLVQHFFQKGNAARAGQYLKLARTKYPDPGYWSGLEMGSLTGKERFARYESLLAQEPGDTALAMDYAVELFNYTYNDKRPADAAVREQRLGSLLTAMSEKSPNSFAVHYIMSQHLANQIYYNDQSIRALADDIPQEASKKAALLKKQATLYESLYQYSLRAFEIQKSNPSLAKPEQKRKVLEQLVNYFQFKRQPDRVEYYRSLL